MARTCLLFLVAAAGLVACDTIEARARAKDAAAAYARGRYEEAAEIYGAAAHRDPELATLWLNRGFACLQLVKAQRPAFASCALESFRTFARLAPNDPRGREYLLATLVAGELYEDAKILLGPEIDRDGPSIEAISVLSQIAQKVGHFDDALDLAGRRAQVEANDPAAHQAIGSLIWDYLYRHADVPTERRLALADRAVEALSRATELSPHAPEPLVFRGLIWRERARAHTCDLDAGSTDSEGCERRATDLSQAAKDADAARIRQGKKDGGT